MLLDIMCIIGVTSAGRRGAARAAGPGAQADGPGGVDTASGHPADDGVHTASRRTRRADGYVDADGAALSASTCELRILATSACVVRHAARRPFPLPMTLAGRLSTRMSTR